MFFRYKIPGAPFSDPNEKQSKIYARLECCATRARRRKWTTAWCLERGCINSHPRAPHEALVAVVTALLADLDVVVDAQDRDRRLRRKPKRLDLRPGGVGTSPSSYCHIHTLDIAGSSTPAAALSMILPLIRSRPRKR